MRLAPHTEGMKKGSSWEGCALPHPPAGGLRPHPPAGRGVGKPGFPTPLLQQPMFTLGDSSGTASPLMVEMNKGRGWESVALPTPPFPRGRGAGIRNQ